MGRENGGRKGEDVRELRGSGRQRGEGEKERRKEIKREWRGEWTRDGRKKEGRSDSGVENVWRRERKVIGK